MGFEASIAGRDDRAQLALLQTAVVDRDVSIAGARRIAQANGLSPSLIAQLSDAAIAQAVLGAPPPTSPGVGSSGGSARGRIDANAFVGRADDIPTVGRASDGWTSKLNPTPTWWANSTLQRALDERTSSVAVDGNAVKILVNGAESQAQRETNIRDADVVMLKTYNFRNDQTGKRMRDLMMERLQAGKKVYVQYDVKGYFSKDAKTIVTSALLDENPIPEDLKALLAAGAVLIPTNANSINPVFDKDHEKYLITWKKGEAARLIMGGMNVGDEWALGGTAQTVDALHGEHGFRDTDCEIRGPAVDRVMREFIHDAGKAHEELRGLKNNTFRDGELHALRNTAADIRSHRSTAFAATGDTQMRFVANRPKEGATGQNIQELYITMLEHVPAGETVTICNPFFLPTQAFVDAVKSAAQRGVKFEFVLNSQSSIEPGMRAVAFASRSVYRELFRACPPGTLNIFEWEGSDAAMVGDMHHKIARFGKTGPVLIGSSNLDAHSLRHNTEGVMLMMGAAVSRSFDRMLGADRASGAMREVSRTDAFADGVLRRTRQWARRRLLGWAL